MLIHPREHFLEDILRVVRREAERLQADRVDVARETLDELVPGLLVSRAATRDDLGVRDDRHRKRGYYGQRTIATCPGPPTRRGESCLRGAFRRQQDDRQPLGGDVAPGDEGDRATLRTDA